MYDPALFLRDAIITLDRSRHPHVSYQPDWGKSFYDTMNLLAPIFFDDIKREEMEYEARMEAQDYEKDDFSITNLQDND